MANPQMQPPILSVAERDRRWASVRGLMRERGFDGLLVAGFRAREMYETYISDDYNEGCVIFPLEGDPVVITWAPSAGDARALVCRARHQALGRRLSRRDERRRRRRGHRREASGREPTRRGGPALAGADRNLRRDPRQFLDRAHRRAAEGALAGHLRGIQPSDAGQERRGDGAGPLCRARRRGRLQRHRRGDGARHRRGSRVRRGDARDAAPRHRPALSDDRHEFRDRTRCPGDRRAGPRAARRRASCSAAI